MEFTPILLFVLFCYVIILLTGIYILIRMYKTKLYNLFGLAMFFILFFMQFLIQQLSYLIYAILAEIPLLFLVIFVRNTFYKEMKSSFPLIIAVLLLLKLFDLILRLAYGFTVPEADLIPPSEIPFYYGLTITVSLQIIISISWLAYASLNMYNKIKDNDIEPWIKKRYAIIGFSSIFFALNGFILPFIPIGAGFDNLFFTILVAITIFIFTFGSSIGWVMPNKLKQFFDKDYKSISEEPLSEKELLYRIKLQLSEGDKNRDH